MRSVLEPLQRRVGHLLDVLGAAVETRCFAVGVKVEAELGGDHHLVAYRREGFAHKFFVRERAVDFGGVEEGDSEVDGGPDNARSSLASSPAGPYPKLMPMQPSPSAETSRPLLPSLRFCIAISFWSN